MDRPASSLSTGATARPRPRSCWERRLPLRGRNIRCDLSSWLDVARFDIASRTGMLPPESLAEIHRKRDALASGDARASLHDEEVDSDPDYRRWKNETLHGVLASLDRSEAPPRKSWTRHLSVAAAAAVLVFGGFWSVRQMQQLREQIAAQGDEIVRLETSSSELTEQLEASNRSLTETTAALSERELRISEGERRVAGLERRIDALETAAVEPNLPFKLLNFVGSREWTRRGDAARRELSAPRPASGGTVRACYRRAQEPK